MHLFLRFAFLIASPVLSLTAEVCQNEVCHKFSADLRANSMNSSVDPCDDFYEYICGNYPAHHTLDPEEEWSVSFLTRQQLAYLEVDEALLRAANSTSAAIRYISRLYTDCVDVATWEARGVTPLIDLAESLLGSWPMIRQPSSHSKTSPKWTDLFADVYSKAGLSFLFDLTSVAQKLRFQVGPILLDPSQHFEPSSHLSNETVVANYRHFLHQMVAILGTDLNSQKVSEEIEKLIHFERQIEAIFSAPEHENVNFIDGTLEDFKLATENSIDWVAVMNRILDNFNSTKARYTPTSKVNVVQLPYVKLIIRLLNTTPIEVIQNFYGTVLALNIGPMTAKALNEAIFVFTRNPRAHAFPAGCAQLPTHWPMALGRIYVDTHFSQHEKADATVLVSEIRASLRVNLQANTWLDSTTKKFAIEKLDAMQQEIGFSDWILNDTRLDALYPELLEQHQVKGKFLENLLKFQIGNLKKEFENIPKSKSLINSNISPVEVNAFYNPLDNSITIPAGILQFPFFDHEMPWAVNYGAIGAIIGHELTHGFDSRGSNYDLHGKLKNWWSKETYAKFHNLTDCLRDQYSALHDPVVGENVNGARTLGENIADNGGVKEAFGAYKAHLAKKKEDATLLPGLNFTSDQLFFVGYANLYCEAISLRRLKEQYFRDAHSPGRYRVNVVLGNTPHFSEAFKCPLGSKMNPAEKCSVW